LPGLHTAAGESQLALGALHIVIFLAKVVGLMLMFIWVRWMWPRFRYDQLMNLGWRVFIPLALANILATAVWLWIMQIMRWS
jgi:NADH-quinone oxidoreductase subunit H